MTTDDHPRAAQEREAVERLAGLILAKLAQRRHHGDWRTEWLMGWPLGWSASACSGMASSPSKPHARLSSSTPLSPEAAE